MDYSQNDMYCVITYLEINYYKSNIARQHSNTYTMQLKQTQDNIQL